MNREHNNDSRLNDLADKLDRQIEDMNLGAAELMFRLEKFHFNLLANTSPHLHFMLDQANSRFESTNNQSEVPSLENK